MTAIETMKDEMIKKQKTQAYCVDQYGIVKPYLRNEYLKLVRDIKELKDGIELMEKMKGR